MSLKVNNTEITNVRFNGTEVNALLFNGTGYFGKRFSLSQNSSTGVTFYIERTNSPNQRASIGNIYAGSSIYYGDEITLTVSANSGYSAPKLFADIGDGQGLLQRTSPFKFVVTDDVTFYGSASEILPEWVEIWSGNVEFMQPDSLTVEALPEGGKLGITGSIEFGTYTYDPYSDSLIESSNYTYQLNNKTIPTTVNYSGASVNFTRSGNKIAFTFNAYQEEYKGYVYGTIPVKVTLTSVKRQA